VHTRRLDTQVTNTLVHEIQDLHYTNDRVGNITVLDNQAPPPQSNLLGGNSKQTYTYDAYDRLTSATGYAPVAPNKRRDYTCAVTYDTFGNGNIATKAQTDLISATTASGAALNDGVRNLPLMGQRWYQPREQVFYSPEPMLYDDPVSTIDDPGLLPAYTYAESNAAVVRQQRQVRPKDVDAKLSNRFSVGQVLQAWTQAKRHSRLWQSLVRLALTKQSDDLKAFTERFEVKPLLEINLTRTDEGHKLQSIEAGFLRFGKTLWEAPIAAPARPVGPAPVGPGVAAGNTTGSAAGPTVRVRWPLPPIPTKPAADNSQVAATVAVGTARGPKPLPPIPGKSGSSNKPGGGGSKPAPDSGAP
jgi:hypothetical protein